MSRSGRPASRAFQRALQDARQAERTAQDLLPGERLIRSITGQPPGAGMDPSEPELDRNARMRRARAERGLRQPPREGAGRPAEAGVAREERIAVPVTPAEKAALRELAAGRPLAKILRLAPAEATRWRAVADGLADALGGENEDAALDAYIAACREM